jgi:hypothetical protein
VRVFGLFCEQYRCKHNPSYYIRRWWFSKVWELRRQERDSVQKVTLTRVYYVTDDIDEMIEFVLNFYYS